MKPPSKLGRMAEGESHFCRQHSLSKKVTVHGFCFVQQQNIVKRKVLVIILSMYCEYLIEQLRTGFEKVPFI